MIRVAAVGDIHMGPESQGVLRPAFDTLPECADVLLLAGDLTRHGTVEEARVVADEIRGLAVPVVAVLGNHDHHDDRPDEVAALLEDAGAQVLEGRGTVVDTAGGRIGVAGTKGFGGGFVGRSAGEFGEPVMKEFVRYSRHCADGLRRSLEELGGQDCDVRVALTHFSPVAETLAGEPLEIYPFLGTYLLAEAIDTAGADLAVHGHAHAGSEHGITSGGVRVRNVAQPVIKRAFNVYHVQGREPAGAGAGAGDERRPADVPSPGYMT
ncbi:metallophosphoesterase family protein [Streptomyces poonensis]|uniref:Metallophosphoesterase n=1 Tax=Streptomyces poonensis TaxID=68255 RepID=A0A918UEB0_9ACTN|nr:metallophosphoesterase [Streptomyces poonensis]GGY99893.1 metallophosphoesterase [Streptomyces poonensis]GLJ92180.1 metallophosphoesterase [Streptomyces poonensis]